MRWACEGWLGGMSSVYLFQASNDSLIDGEEGVVGNGGPVVVRRRMSSRL